MRLAIEIISLLSGLALIVSVMFQTSKADGFSAAMGSGSETRFKPGSREEWLYKITRVSAIVWIVSCLLVAVFWYARQ
jgi:protein translocase SecG subunit